MYIACLCPNLVSVHFYAIPILHFKFPKFFIYLYIILCTTKFYRSLARAGSYRRTKIFKMNQYFRQFRSGGTKIFIKNFDPRTISAGTKISVTCLSAYQCVTVTYVRANLKISPLICILLPTHLSMLNVSVPEWLCTSLVDSTVQNGSLC